MPRAEAEYFGLKLGDEIVLSTRTRFGAFNTGILVVRGIYESTNYFAKSAVLAHFDYLRDVDLSEPTPLLPSEIEHHGPTVSELVVRADDHLLRHGHS